MTTDSPQCQQPPLLVIAGPTASGKTGLALELARHFPVEVVSADSRQVYRGMDIGTAKPSHKEQRQVAHHLIDVVDPDQDFSAADFVQLGRRAVSQIHASGRLPLLVGGTGLYIQSLTEGLVEAPGRCPQLRSELREREEADGEGTLYTLLKEHDPETAGRLQPSDQMRIIRALEVFFQSGKPLSVWQQEHSFGDRPYRVRAIGVAISRDELNARIDARTLQMMGAGLVEETRGLLDNGYDPGLKAMQTLGYRECQQLLAGKSSYEETVAAIQLQTRRYAKRQRTWFRKYGNINWFDNPVDFAKIASLVDHFLLKSQRSGHG